MARAWRLLPVIALLGLASCSDRLPSQPQVGLVGNVPSGAPLDSTLEANRALWSASRPAAYRYRFQWVCFCVQEHIRVVDITVANRSILSVVDAETREPLSGPAAAQYRTIDGLFDFVQESIDYPAASIQAAFDPHLGYPSQAYVDYVAGIADEEMGFRVFALSPFKRR